MPNFREAAKRMKAAVAANASESAKQDAAFVTFLLAIGGRDRHDRITIAAMRGAFHAGWKAQKETPRKLDKPAAK